MGRTVAKARMPISTARLRDRGGRRQWTRLDTSCLAPQPLGRSGFTLLELTLVLLIIVVILALTIPRLRDPGRAELLAQSHRLVLTFRLLRSEAVLNGSSYRLIYDLDQQRYWVTVADQSADLADFAHSVGALARGTKLESPVGITDIVLPTLAGKVAQGQIYTVFYPDGSVDPTVIHLANGKEAYTLYVDPMNSRLRMETGYREVDYTG
jgi:prepilin-type N-terminal cleavage/methylation domain-containing protein